MEHPSVQAPDTFYPEAVSHNTAAGEKTRGAIFPEFRTFPAVKGLLPARISRPASAPAAEIWEKIRKNASFSSLSAIPFIFPDYPSPAFRSAAFAVPLHHERKNRSSRKKRHTSVQTGINSGAFVRLFLTLGKNTLDYLPRINK